ncbi:MAG TPA: AI-2E family transporter [Ktedonobacterales bacterium]|nr:AI-2E family transporter [Ktedonobacterales bacterium]
MDRWIRARDVGIAILVWVAVIIVFFWLIGQFVTAVLLFVIAALLAYALLPGVTLLERWMPRMLAVAIVYLLALAVIGSLGYFVFSTAIEQLVTFVKDVPDLLKPSTPGHPSPIYHLLHPLGITEAQIDAARQQAVNWLEGSAGQIVNSAVPILTSVAGGIIDTIVVLILSVYLVIDGPRVFRWLSTASPRKYRLRVIFFLNILRRTVGGYIRGQLFMSTFIGVLVGGGMAAFQVPYALLLGLLAFILEFVPILGTIISGVACVLLALATRGFIIAALVLGYFIIVHILEGDVVGPRVTGRVLGLHPVVAILALVAGTDLFGIWGAVFAAPVVGLAQAIIVSAWREWRSAHPEEYQKTPLPPKEVEPKPEPEPEPEPEREREPTAPPR